MAAVEYMTTFVEHDRQSIRLPAHDYSQAGAYFVTICAFERECLFGKIENGEMELNECGKIVADEWMNNAIVRTYVELDEFAIMPNHFHGIIWLHDDKRPVGATRRVAPTQRPNGPRPKSIGSIMGQFKSLVTKRIRIMRKNSLPVWQRNFYERIIRSESELFAARRYIRDNPKKWETDVDYR